MKKVINFSRKLLLSEHFMLYVCIFLFILLIPAYRNINGIINNLGLISSNLWPLFILVIGQMFVLIVKGIDLSQVSVMALTSIVGGILMTNELDPAKFSENPLWGSIITENGGLLANHPYATVIGILSMVLVGAFFGCINGLSIAKLKMPPFMVTLVSMMLLSGLALSVSQTENVRFLPDSYLAIGKGGWKLFPNSIFLALGVGIMVYYILNKTVLGRWFYAVGQNIKTSVISGVPTNRVIVLAYTFSGICAALASVIYSSRLGQGSPYMGENKLLDIIGAAVIGGISLFGGKGKWYWALYGALFFTLLANALDQIDMDVYVRDVIKGVVILLAVSIDVYRIQLAAKQK